MVQGELIAIMQHMASECDPDYYPFQRAINEIRNLNRQIDKLKATIETLVSDLAEARTAK